MKVKCVAVVSGHGKTLVNGVQTTAGKGQGDYEEGDDNGIFAAVLCLMLSGFYMVQNLIGTCPINVRLGDRVKTLNLFSKKNTIGIGIHANAGPEEARGHTVFYYPFSKKGKILAQCISDELKKIPGIPSRGIKAKGFFMLKRPKMVYVLVERYFFTNKEDRRLGTSASEQELQSIAIKRAVDKFQVITEELGIK